MVKIAMKTLSEKEFIELVRNENIIALHGGSLKDINIFRIDRKPLHGSGIIDTLTKIGRFIFPAVKKYIAPAALDFTKDVYNDMRDGRKIRESLKKQGVKSLKRLGSRILHGRGKKRKLKSKKLTKIKKSHKQGCGTSVTRKMNKKKKQNRKTRKRKYNDIFS